MVAYKIVWVASIPRTGSMWTYNVARELLKEAGKTVEPEVIPMGRDEMLGLGNLGLNDPDPNRIWVLKVHRPLRLPLPRSRLITTHRDPRDIVMSWMRFMRISFDQSLASISAAWPREIYFRTAAPEISLRLAYNDVVQRPMATACLIARFLGLDEGKAPAITERLQKEKVAEKIKATEQTPGPRTGNRRFDPQSGFQSGHVSDYRDGDWRYMLSAEQQRRMHAALGVWLRKAGYHE